MKTTVDCQVKKKENKLAKMNNTLAADTDLLRTTCGSSAIDSSRIEPCVLPWYLFVSSSCLET